ncbi:hypothetical protein FACS189446_5310 [Bacteroidia bacterium]|nr:hypothetical protein FACS189446_5310 [Bacteroidia bacterium]
MLGAKVQHFSKPPKLLSTFLTISRTFMHEEDLIANWELATTEQNIFTIEPFK